MVVTVVARLASSRIIWLLGQGVRGGVLRDALGRVLAEGPGVLPQLGDLVAGAGDEAGQAEERIDDHLVALIDLLGVALHGGPAGPLEEGGGGGGNALALRQLVQHFIHRGQFAVFMD